MPRNVLIGGLVVLASIAAWRATAQLHSHRAAYETGQAQLTAMHADSVAVRRLLNSPRQATDRRLPHERLVAQIQDACAQASLPSVSLVSIWPESPKRLQESDYQEIVTRVSLERVGLRELATFAYVLRAMDGSLSISGLRLTAVRNDPGLWDAELSLGYLVYSPARVLVAEGTGESS